MFDGIWSQFRDNPNYDEMISAGAQSSMTDLSFLATETQKWLHSPRRRMQLRGNAWYHYDFDDEARAIGRDADGMPVYASEDTGRVIDNQYANLVDQHVNYVLGKPFTVTTTDDAYEAQLNLIFDRPFKRMLSRTAIDAINEGIAWVFPYYNAEGQMEFQEFPAHEILPFWQDAEHTKLDCAIRYYETLAYEGREERTVAHVELYTKSSVKRFVFENGSLVPDVERGAEVFYAVADDGQPQGWERIPLIAFKYNAHEIPMVKRVETQQKALNRTRTNWTQMMNKDINTTILAVKGYDGENVKDLREKLQKYGAVLLEADGDVQPIEIQRGCEDYIGYITQLKKSLVENARGFDAKDDRVSSNPNEMNLRSMYSDIDLDADMMETQFQAGFDELLWFIDQYLLNAGVGDFTQEDVVFTFDRNMIVNDSDTINNIRNSDGIVSRQTLLAHHPYVTDVQQEMDRLQEEQDAQAGLMDDYTKAADVGDEA
ncbi:MAG: phage portal protein [Selenomonadaceae bacterium]|nr:phage portal protein [Selenomonadaceae bacterium]